MTDEHLPQQPAGLPPPPPPATADSWSAGTPTPKRRPTGLIVGAIVAVLAVIAGFVAFTTLGGQEDTAAAQPLALAFTDGQRETYTMHMTMDGQMRAGETLGGDQPLVMDMTQVVSWEVTDVDDEGVATITVTVEQMSGTVNGIAIPAEASAMAPVEIRIAPDGRVLEAGGLSFAGAGQAGGAAFPGMDQMTPLLPDGPVQPGDSWEKEFSQDVPFGEGTISFTATSTLERYEDVDGVRAAVITTEMTVPLDFTIDFGELLATMGQTGGVPTGAAGFEDATIDYGGEGSFTQTAWVDVEGRQMLRMTSSGDFDMTMAFGGLDVFEGQEIGFSGTFTQDVTRAAA